jgi:tetratricopeptide (TPR) repeat protein
MRKMIDGMIASAIMLVVAVLLSGVCAVVVLGQDDPTNPLTNPAADPTATPLTAPAVEPTADPDAIRLTPIKEGKVTPIKGGYHVEWRGFAEIGSFKLNNNLAGKFEIQFDISPDAVDVKPKKPDSPELLMVLANYWLTRGKPERAMTLYQRGLELAPDNALFSNNLAMLRSKVNKDHDGAIAMIDRALATRVDNVELLDTKGLILLNADRAGDAIEPLEQAVTLSCEGPLYVLHLIKAYDQNGDEGRARRKFESAQSPLLGAKDSFSKDSQAMWQELKAKYGTTPRE